MALRNCETACGKLAAEIESRCEGKRAVGLKVVKPAKVLLAMIASPCHFMPPSIAHIRLHRFLQSDTWRKSSCCKKAGARKL